MGKYQTAAFSCLGLSNWQHWPQSVACGKQMSLFINSPSAWLLVFHSVCECAAWSSHNNLARRRKKHPLQRAVPVSISLHHRISSHFICMSSPKYQKILLLPCMNTIFTSLPELVKGIKWGSLWYCDYFVSRSCYLKACVSFRGPLCCSLLLWWIPWGTVLCASVSEWEKKGMWGLPLTLTG